VIVTGIGQFLEYRDRVHFRAPRVMTCIARERLEWSFLEGKFTLGDIIPHLAGIDERDRFVEGVLGRPPRYPGPGRELAGGYDQVLAYFDRLRNESTDLLRTLTPQDLQPKSNTPEGSPITTWKWLRSMIEHEVHHRGQIICTWECWGVPTPHGTVSRQSRFETVARQDGRNPGERR